MSSNCHLNLQKGLVEEISSTERLNPDPCLLSTPSNSHPAFIALSDVTTLVNVTRLEIDI